MEKKFELIPSDVDGLFRVKALRDFGDVKGGDVGGYVARAENLSHEGDCWVFDNARVWGNAKVWGNARVWGNAEVHGDAKVWGNARVHGDALVHGNALVHGIAKVYGDAEVWGDAEVCGDAEVSSTRDYIVFKNWWSSGRYFTWTRSNDMWRVGCFYGTGEELIKKAYADCEESGMEYERIVRYVEEIKKGGEK